MYVRTWMMRVNCLDVVRTAFFQSPIPQIQKSYRTLHSSRRRVTSPPRTSRLHRSAQLALPELRNGVSRRGHGNQQYDLCCLCLDVNAGDCGVSEKARMQECNEAHISSTSGRRMVVELKVLRNPSLMKIDNDKRVGRITIHASTTWKLSSSLIAGVSPERRR